ncbi:6550_t:CDS:2, partial [Cetraspora pellucida]
MPSDTIVSLPSETIKKFEANGELDLLRQEISDIKEWLEKIFRDSESQEDYIDYLEKLLQEVDNIRRYFQSPTTITPTINSIIDYLNIISDARNRLERIVLEIYLQANARAINAENRKNKCKTLENDLLLADVQLDNKWALQYNPSNIATVAEDLTSIASLIAQIPNYSGQIPPDEWYQRINQILTLSSIMAGTFNNALRADILKSTNIDTPARFIVWLHHKYQTETVGTQQVATQRLAQEKFLPFDNPESYEARICPLLLGVADGDANILGLLKGHLSGELYTWMKITNPGGIDAFFTELKNMWLEHPPNLYKGSIPDQIFQTSAVNIQNKLHSDSSGISRAELDSMIKSQLALVPTISIQSSQLQKTQALQSQQKQPDFSNYLRVPDKYMPERPPVGYGVNSEKFIHCDLINPTPSASQIIESLANNLYKKVSDMFSAKPMQSKKNIEVDSDKELADHMGKLSINKVLSKGFEAGVHAVIKSSKHCCSNCNKTGHNSRKCPRKKSKNSKRSSKNKKSKGKKKVNQKSSSSKLLSKKVSKSHKIDKEPKSCKRGGSKQTVLEQTICKIIQKPASEISNSDEDETLDDPMEIDFVCQKEPNIGIATIPCKIKCLKIPAMILDSGTETEIITEDIFKRINGKIDRSVKYDLSGNLLITLTPDCTIYENFVVVKHSKPMLIFLNRLLKKYEYVIDWNNDKMKIHHNGKDHIFPVTMHKVKNKLEVNCTNVVQDNKPLISDQISQKIDRDEDDSIPFDEWCASADFSLDSVNLTLAKQAPK